MYYDLMLLYSFYIFIILLISSTTFCQQTFIYVKRGGIAELCDNRTTSIYAYEYRSFDGQKNSILEPLKHERYSNPYLTSVLRITNVTENDSGQYKCPQDDTEWQNLQVYIPVQYVQLNNKDYSSRMHSNDLCGVDNNNCISMIEGESLDVICIADGYPRPALEISLDKNGTMPKIMALATESIYVNDQSKSSVSEAYRITGLTPADNGRNITCHVDMKHIDKNLSLSSTKQLYIEFAPKVIEKSKKIYCGINQTRTINCTIQHANPPYIRYSINGLSSSVVRRTYGDQHDLQYRFDITPTSIDQFRPFNVTANNSIGFDTCTYELIHGGVPDAITQCTVDTYTSNITITISCTKSYAQGDNDGYACTLFKYNDKSNTKMFEEIARAKSCIFALDNFREPVEFRVSAFNRYGSLPVNTYGYIIKLNELTLSRETPFFNRKMVIITGSLIGGFILIFFLCCLCGPCNRDYTKSSDKKDYEKTNLSGTSNESEALKSATDDTIAHLVPSRNEKHGHQNGTVYDIPSHLNNGKYSQQTSSTPTTSVYHQQKPITYIDRDSINDSVNSIPTRTRIVNNKFYGHPVIDHKYGTLSPPSMVVPTRTVERNNINDEEEGDDSPVYSTTTDVMSESGSFLVPSSSKRYAPPHPKPRYSTLSSIRLPHENYDKTPLPRPRSRSNSRTRLNNPNFDNPSLLYEERPLSSSDSGMGQSDVVCLPNGDTIRTGLVKSRQDTLQKQYTNPSTLQHQQQQQPRYHTLTSPTVHGTEC